MPILLDGGATLFESFDQDIQEQIDSFLGRLVHMLNEAISLLNGRYGINNPKSPPLPVTTFSSSSTLVPSKSSHDTRTPSPRSWKIFPRKSVSIIKWSLQDKKRTGEILKDFSDLNGRIHENIKLWCLASSIGLNMQHLKRLQDDESSKQLGFDIDAALQLQATEVRTVNRSFELGQDWHQTLHDTVAVEDKFSLSFKDGKVFLIENRQYEGHMDNKGDIDPRTKERVNKLAALLSQPKEKVFCIPRCIGWKYVNSRSSISFAFEAPSGHQPGPLSLYRLLDVKSVQLTLGQRFR